MLFLAETDVTLVQGLPPEAHVTLAVAFLGGLVLWAAGAKVLRPMFALLGVLIGAFVGLVAAGILGLGSFGGIGGWLITMLIGGVIGLVVTLALVKMAIVFTAAATFLVVGFAGGMVYVQATGGPAEDIAPPVNDTADRDSDGGLLFKDPRTDALVPLAMLFSDDEDDNPESVTAEQVEHVVVLAARVQATVRSAIDLAARHWAALGTDQKAAVAGSTLGGLAIGLFAGFFLPKRSTAVITALGGSAAFLFSGVALIEGLPWLAPARNAVAQTPIVWALVWAGVAALGLLVQLKLISKNKPKDSKKPKDD
ncbi:MAG: hypothetical protein AAF297_04015 [Planctomycetota bacterium]